MGRPKAFDETTALDAAAQLFWSQGFDGTSMTDLESSMQMGRQSIYNAFGDKRQLFLRALERYSAHNRERLQASLLAPDAGLDTIRDYFEDGVVFLTPEGERPGCLVANSILEIGESDGDVAGSCSRNQASVLDGFEHALRNAVKAGDLPTDTDVESTARMLMSQTYGLTVLAKSGMSREELRSSVRTLFSLLG